MQTRVKLFSNYRKRISTETDLEACFHYEGKHYLSKDSVNNKKLDKKVKEISQYEEKRNALSKLYKNRMIAYYIVVSVISILVIILVSLIGVHLFK